VGIIELRISASGTSPDEGGLNMTMRELSDSGDIE
jgi:hypothetical protein